MTEPESSLRTNTPYKHQRTDIKPTSAATQTLVSIRGFLPEAKLSRGASPHQSEPRSQRAALGAALHFQHVGVGGLSFCTCADEALAVLVCVNQQSTKRLILQAEHFSDVCGREQCVCCVLYVR